MFAPALLWLLFPERIQDQTALHDVGTLAQVLADVLGLGFTILVVAIVVQLSASRFTPKVTELFLKEKVNFIILFLITIILNTAHHFRYYCFLAHKAELVFLPETFAFDLGVLA